METLFAVERKTTNAGPNTNLGNGYNIPIRATVSTCNIVAYVTHIELDDTTNSTWGFYVYVADINTPWFSYKVTTNKCPISVLEWDVLGKYLLIGDIFGNVQIWIQKDNLISEWHQLYSINFPGEHIIKAVFFHNGRKIQLVTDKKDLVHYMDKFQRVKFAPSVRQFGGVPADGVLVITSTGMLGSFLIPSELPNTNLNQSTNNGIQPPSQQQQQHQGPFTLTPVTESLGHTRNFITTADVSFGKDGRFLIAVANGECTNAASTMINCFRVIVKKQNDKLTITSHSMPSFFLCEGGGREIPELRITHLKWISSEDSDSLLVATKCPSGSFLELWCLVEKSTPIHKLFQTTNKTEVFKTVIWTHQVNYRYSSNIVDICTSKFHYGNFSYIFLTMLDNTIHCLNRDSLKRSLPIASLTCIWRNDNEHSSKHMRLESQIAAHDITWMGHLLMSVDTQGQLYAYKITYPHQDQSGNQMSISYFVSLLEYCLVVGYDSLDIFTAIKIPHLDTIIDRLTENFTRQPSPVQQYYYVNFFTLKTNLYRLSIPGQLKAHDLTRLLMLHSILIAFKSLLRPSDLTSHDKGPAENLAMVLADSVTDIDKVLLGLDGKDFTVEKSTLQSLQQLIQWVADLALNILAKLPENRSMVGGVGSSRNSGYEISKDIVALNSIRELLVMMRIWGLLKPQCLPVFSRSADNLDILATLFKLLTRLVLNPNDPDELLLDDCCLLPSQVLIPQLQYIPSQTALTSPYLFYVNLPISLEYNVKPSCLKFCPDVPVVEGGLSNNSMVDSVRHLQLGKRPPSLRRCSRCGACSSTWSVARTAAMRAWEQRWASGCRCGGFWRLETLN